jgi:hypothetical protein
MIYFINLCKLIFFQRTINVFDKFHLTFFEETY